MHVETRDPDPVTRRMVDACVEAGFDRLNDLNGAQQEGVAFTQVNQKRGMRHDAATAFLGPARRRPNLMIKTGALVHSVLPRGDRATSVEISFGKTIERFAATDEIVLSAGADDVQPQDRRPQPARENPNRARRDRPNWHLRAAALLAPCSRAPSQAPT